MYDDYCDYDMMLMKSSNSTTDVAGLLSKSLRF